MFTLTFLRKAGELAVRGAAAGALLALGSDVAENGGLNALAVDWATVGGFFVGGAVLSLLFSLAGSRLGDPQDPTFTG